MKVVRKSVALTSDHRMVTEKTKELCTMFTDNLKPSSESMNRFNKLVMDTYEGLVEAQMESLRGYMEIVKDQSKSALAIRDLDDVKNFVKTQPERLNAVVNRMSEDFQHFSRITEEFRNETSGLFREPADGDAAENAGKASTAKASTPAKKNATPAS
ncbi:MAG TPA: hypothetical protein DHU56_06105 [Marinobacter sp.]|nr:hypothetical protein [Marinobacter sp.]